jgi:hypothetical protein
MDADATDVERAESTGGEATASIVDGEEQSGADAEAVTTESEGFEPLTIGLPDGSESVSEAILSHRQMLTNPSDHGLVAAEEAREVVATVESLSEEVPEDLQGELAALEESADELADRLDHQERQIEELRETVRSLAEILGASVEFRTAAEE